MNKININFDNVVIGSGSIEEAKFQILNFMNMLYDCIIKDNDYSYNGYSNIGTNTHNLINELKTVEKFEPHQYIDLNKHYGKVKSIETILRLLYKEDSKEYKKYIKAHCIRIWNDLLKDFTKLYNLKYTLN